MAAVEFTDVTLRDGLQMESKVFTVDQKLALLKALIPCGYDRIEVTSFASATAVPQFADAEVFCQKLLTSGIAKELPPLMAFVPNDKGCDRLLAYEIPWVSCFVSVSEEFNKKNVNATVDESLYQVEAVVNKVREKGRKVRVYVSTVFGCPYQGKIPPGALTRVLRTVATLSPDEIALGDTIGVATPTQVKEVIGQLADYFPMGKIALHLHNTYGLAVATARMAHDLGVRKFDVSTGGIGGCPYAKGASGNVAAEDLLYSLYRDGLTDKFPGKALQETLKLLATDLGLTPQSRLADIWKKGGTWFGTF